METTCSEPQHDLTADRVYFVPSDKHAVHFLVYISSQFFQTLKLLLPSATGLV